MPDFEVGFVPFPEIQGASGLSGSPASARPGSSPECGETDAAAALIDFLFLAGGRGDWIGGSRYFVPVEADLSNIELGPLYQQVIDTLQSAEEEGVRVQRRRGRAARVQRHDVQRLPGDPGSTRPPSSKPPICKPPGRRGWREGGGDPGPVTRCTARAG